MYPLGLLQAAVDMMRKVLNTVNMDGVIVIGEGEKDEVRRTLRLQLPGALTFQAMRTRPRCWQQARTQQFQAVRGSRQTPSAQAGH